MNINIYHHYPDREETREFLLLIIKQLKQMSQQLTDLQNAVAAEATVIDSAVTLLSGLKTSLDAEIALLASAGADTSSLQALTDGITAKTQELAAAITANTPTA